MRKLPDFLRTLFASFGSTPKERDSNDMEVSVSDEVEEQYRSHFLYIAMNGTYEDARDAYDLYQSYKGGSCL